MIGTKWLFRNKINKKENVLINIARLIVKGYNQQEGINFDKTCLYSYIRGHKDYISHLMHF